MSLARIRSVGAVLLLLLTIAVAVETRSAAPARAATTFTNPVAAAPYGADPWLG
jgi:hypothetical protein